MINELKCLFISQILNVFCDPFGAVLKKTIDNLTSPVVPKPIITTAPHSTQPILTSKEHTQDYMEKEDGMASGSGYSSFNKSAMSMEVEYDRPKDRERDRFTNGRVRHSVERAYREDRERGTRSKYSSSSRHSRHYYSRGCREKSPDSSRERIYSSRDRDRDTRSYEYSRSKGRDKFRERERSRDLPRERLRERRDHRLSPSKERDYRERDRSIDMEGDRKDRNNAKHDKRYLSNEFESYFSGTPASNIDPSGSYGYSQYSYTMSESVQSWSTSHRRWHATEPVLAPPPPPEEEENWDDPQPSSLAFHTKDQISPSSESIVKKPLSPKRTSSSKSDNNIAAVAESDAATENVDLDTRIALIFKGKTFGNAPPFLQMDSSDSETDKTKAEEAIESIESHCDSNSSHNKKTVDKNVSSIQPHGASDISSDEDILNKKETQKPALTTLETNDNDDNMSLSSLSSHEETTKMSVEPTNQINTKILPTGYADLKITATDQSNYYYHHPAYAGYGHYPSSIGTNSGLAEKYFTNSAYMQASYLPGVVPPDQFHLNAYAQSYSHYHQHTQPGQNDELKQNIKKVTNIILEELKQILKRDVNKRMIEMTAFKNFEVWWDEQTAKARSKHMSTAPDVPIPVTNNIVEKPTSIEKPPDINHLINTQREMPDFQSFSSIGLRAAMPKLPSFRRVPKNTSPIPDKLERDLSDQEEMVQRSDSEKEDSNLGSSDAQNISLKRRSIQRDVGKLRLASSNIRLKRKGSASSFFSSSTSSSSSSSDNEDDNLSDGAENQRSSDDDESFDTDLQMSNTNEREKFSKRRESKSTDGNINTVYSDSEEENQSINRISSTKRGRTKKIDIYSDSDEENDRKAEDLKTGNKTKHNIISSIPSDLEDISKDSSFGTEETGKTESELKTDGEDKIDSESRRSPTPVPPPDYNEETVSKPDEGTNAKTHFEYDRIYSDSEEEREYQEKRRRNTEYMAQIEREFLEEQQMKANQPENTLDSNLSLDIKKLPPFDAPRSSDITQQSSTFERKLENLTDDLVMYKKGIQAAESKHQINRNADETKEIQYSDASIATADVKVPVIVKTENESNAEIISQANDDARAYNGKQSPASSDSGSSQASQASQVALEHCYSLPPQAQSTSGNSVSKVKKESDINQIAKPGPGRPRKDSVRAQKKRKDSFSVRQPIINKKIKTDSMHNPLSDLIRETANFVPREMFNPRDQNEEMVILYTFLTKGIDLEDIKYIKTSYIEHLQKEPYA